jgi:hypothetical protein
MVSLRWTLMGCIGFELFDVVKDLIQETKEEIASAGGGGSGTLISKSNAERSLTWMADPNPDKKPLPYQVPIMSLQIALQLQASGVPLFSSSSDASMPSIADILPRLTKPQACLLTDVLGKAIKESRCYGVWSMSFKTIVCWCWMNWMVSFENVMTKNMKCPETSRRNSYNCGMESCLKRLD